MERTSPQLNAAFERAPVNGNGTTPFSQQTVVLTKQADIELTWQAHDWQAQYEQLLKREAALKAQVATHEATIRDLKQRLYGKKSEKSTGPERRGESKPLSTRKRGQQPGSQGHGRSDRSALPVVTEVQALSEEMSCCPACGQACAPFPGIEESDRIEVQVQAHIRRIQRLRYHKTCQCPQVPGIVTAPPAPRVIPKSPLGVSVWTRVLLDKYLYGRPTYRLCEALRHHGFPLSQGTLTDGLQRLAGLLKPLMPRLYERQMTDKLFHGDETRWEVFEEIEGNRGPRWYLWVMQAASVGYSLMAPGRGADVPQGHCAKLRQALGAVVLVGDRSRASTCLAKDHDARIVACCWAHVRRDFLKGARRWPELERGMVTWGDAIRDLYRRKTARRAVWEETLPLAQPPAAFAEPHHDLQTTLSERQARCEAHLQEPALHVATQTVLSSLHNHWEGLTVFAGYPEVAMEKNTAERRLRPPVGGRKNSEGAGRVWSASLAAMMWSVLHPMLLWGLKPHHWLSAFCEACADNGGQSPTDLGSFLPWQMTPERRAERSRPVAVRCPSVAFQTQEPGEPEAAKTSECRSA